MAVTHKKRSEIALALKAINKAVACEKSICHGPPGILHLWWSRRPLSAADLVKRLGFDAEVARELAYRLYTHFERKNRTPEAFARNGLVLIWAEVMRLAQECGNPRAKQAQLFEDKD